MLFIFSLTLNIIIQSNLHTAIRSWAEAVDVLRRKSLASDDQFLGVESLSVSPTSKLGRTTSAGSIISSINLPTDQTSGVAGTVGLCVSNLHL